MLWTAALLAAFIAGLLVLVRLADVNQYDTDEGVNLIKALLVTRGHDLYSEIWNDQPPLFTLVLAGLIKIFGNSVYAARVASMCFSALLLGSFFALLRQMHSKRVASIGVVLLVASGWYLRLSVSVMIGLPALALAVASLALLARYAHRPGWATLVFSAIAIALAAQVKMFVLLCLPAALLILCFGRVRRDDSESPTAEKGASWRGRGVALAAWLGVGALAWGAVWLAYHPPPAQVFESHRVASVLRAGKGSLVAPVTLMRRDTDLLICAVAVIAVMIPHRPARPAIAAVVWLGAGMFTFLTHRPAWYHHSLVLTIPAAWAAAVTIDALIEQRTLWRAQGRTAAAGALLVVVIAFFGWQGGKLVYAAGRLFIDTPKDEQLRVADALRRSAETDEVPAEEDLVFTDQPIFAYLAGLSVPPELAVISSKRAISGQMPDDFVIEVLRRHRPRQVLTTERIKLSPRVIEFIQQEYQPVAQFELGKPANLYILRQSPPPATAATQPSQR